MKLTLPVSVSDDGHTHTQLAPQAPQPAHAHRLVDRVQSSTLLYTGDPACLATARGSAPPSPAARTPATCAAMGAGGERQPGIGQARVPVQVRSRRRAPRQRTDRPGGRAARSSALSAPSSAVGRRACGRPRRGAVAAVLPHWDDDDDRLPGGRLTRALPPRANGHDRGAWCERRNRTASARWAPRLHGQPASCLHWHATRACGV